MPCKAGSIAILKVLRVHCYDYIEQSHSMHCIYTFLNRDNKLCVLCSPEMYGYSVPLNAGGCFDQLDENITVCWYYPPPGPSRQCQPEYLIWGDKLQKMSIRL